MKIALLVFLVGVLPIAMFMANCMCCAEETHAQIIVHKIVKYLVYFYLAALIIGGLLSLLTGNLHPTP